MKRNTILFIFVLIALVIDAQQVSLIPTSNYGFIPDHGQLHDQNGRRAAGVRYIKPASDGLNVQIRNSGISYDTYSSRRSVEEPFVMKRLDVQLLDASEAATFLEESPRAGYLNFYNEVAPEGVSGVPNFDRIVQSDVYPGIDLVHQVTPEGRYKYDLVVHEGSDLAQIKLEYSGHDRVEVRDDALIFDLGDRTLTETLPGSWWSSSHDPVALRFVTLEEAPGRIVVGIEAVETLVTPAGASLVIDPMPYLEWGTFFGHTGVDAGTAIATDTIGFLHVAGYTDALLTLATSNAHQSEYGGGETDAFLLRMASWGSPIWCTYYGGVGADHANGVHVDHVYDIYMVGHTDSTDSLVTDSTHQAIYAGGNDAFIVKFDSNGTRLWASYLGGSADDIATSCVADRDGRVYVAGSTSNADLFNTAAVAPTIAHGGGTDAFVALFGTTGLIEKCTFKGGTADDHTTAIARDHTDAIILVGSTSSTDGIALPGSYQEQLAGPSDGFLSLFNDSLGAENWSSYFGGSAEDSITSVVIADSTIYFTGHTTSQDPINDTTAMQPLPGGSSDAFIAQFSLEGDRIWSTYFGGAEDDRAYGISADTDGDVYIIGTTSSPGLATADVFQDQLNGEEEIFLARLDSINALKWCSYYGGSADDHGAALSVYGVTVIFFTGSTTSIDAVMQGSEETGGLQMENGGGSSDAIVMRFIQMESTPPVELDCNGGGGSGGSGGSGGGTGVPVDLLCAVSYSEYAICLGDSLTIDLVGGALGFGSYWMWYGNDCGNPSNFLAMGPQITIAPTSDILITVRAENVYSYSECRSIFVRVDQPVIATAIAPDTVCMGDTIPLSATEGTCYYWTGPQDFEAFTATAVATTDSLTGSQEYVVLVVSEHGACTDTDTATVFISTVAEVEWEIVHPSCAGLADGSISADSLSSIGFTFEWPQFSADSSAVAGLASGEYHVNITDGTGCSRMDTLLLIDPDVLVDTLVASDPTCGLANGSIQVIVEGDPDQFIFDWGVEELIGAEPDSLAAGNYAVNIIDPLGCIHDVSVTLMDTGSFMVTILADTNQITLGETTTMAAILDPPDEVATFVWSPATGLNDSTLAEVIASPDTTTLYTVTVISSLGCTATEEFWVNVFYLPIDTSITDTTIVDPFDPGCPELFIPTMFSPNGDGLNDRFGILGGCLQEMRLLIHDRSGILVFEGSSCDVTWDGTFNGVPINSSAVQFTFTAIDVNGAAIDRVGILNIVR